MKARLNSLRNLFKRSTYFRFAIRSVVVSGISYAIAAWQADNAASLKDLLFAFAGGGLNVIVGLLTPSEPLVGPKAVKVKIDPPAK